MRLVHAIPLSALSLVAPLFGEERISEVRLHGAFYGDGGDLDTSYTDNTGGNLVYETSDVELRYRAGIVILGSVGSISGFGAPVFGIGLTSFESEVTDVRIANGQVDTDGNGTLESGGFTTNTDANLTGTVFVFQAGWAWGLLPGLHLETLGHFGIGTLVGAEEFAIYDQTSGDLANTEFRSASSGNYREAGVEAGLFYTIPSGLQIGVTAGFLAGSGESRISAGYSSDQTKIYYPTNGGSYLEEFEVATAYGQVALGFRW